MNSDLKNELALITGQKPAETRSKKSIANFKLRQHQAIGAKVTLRGPRMYEFRSEERTGADHRPETGRNPLEEEHRELQASPAPGDRREGDPPRPAHV